MLKIGITCYPLIGGSGILATALGAELARRGHEVHFFSFSKPVRLDLTQPRIHFHEVVVNEYSLFRYPDYTLPLAVKMAEVARQAGLEIFHVHYAVPHATAAYLAVQMLRRTATPAPKIVTTLHGTDTTLLGQDPSYREAIEHALSESDAVTTVSESLRAETCATFALQKAVEVVPNFFIPSQPRRDRATVRRALGISEEEFLIVHTSNMRPPKRIDLLLRTFAAMRTERPRRLLLLAGGPFTPYEPLLRELALEDRVLVEDNVAEVEDFLAAADAGLYTSESESFGLSILETLFHAKPVAAFRVGGIPEVVRAGETGRLEEFGDTAALARALDDFADQPERARMMGAAGARDAAARFSAEAIVPIYEALYQRLTSQS